MVEKEENSLEKKIREDINKTGFVTELNTASILLEKKWVTEHSLTYEDKDENKSREFDIAATKSIIDGNIRVSLFLCIEIKKSSKPWVIFTIKKPAQASWVVNLLMVGTNWKKPGPLGGVKGLSYSDLNPDSAKSSKTRIGKAFHEAFKDPKEKSQIYSALISSSKAAVHHRNLSFKPKSELYKKNSFVGISIFQPVVVVDGDLYEVYNESNGITKIEKTNYLPIELYYSSPNYQMQEQDIVSFFAPDLVKFDYLDSYLQKMEDWLKELHGRAKANIDKWQ